MSFWTKVPFSLEWCCCRCKEYFSRAVTRVFLCFQPCCCNVFNWELKVITTLVLYVSLYDWSMSRSRHPLNQSVVRTQTNHDSISRIFRALGIWFVFTFEFSLSACENSQCSDRPLWWLLFIFYTFSRDALFDVGDWSKSNWLFFLLICSLQRRGTWTRRSIFKVNSSFCFTPLQSYVASLR